MPALDDKPIVLAGDPFDPVTQLVADDLIARGKTIELNAPPDPNRHSSVLWCDQGRCLAGLLQSVMGQLSGQVILRRPGQIAGDASWATGMAAIGALQQAMAPGKLALAALTEAAARTFDTAGLGEVPLWQPLARQDPSERRRLPATVDPAARVIRTARGELSFEAQNWVQVSQMLRLRVDLLPPGDLQDVAVFSNHLPHRPAAGGSPVFLAVVTNGVGLGHLTRLLSIADALRAKGGRTVFWCFSQAAGLLCAAGYQVIQRMTAHHLRSDHDAWIDWEAAAFATCLRDLSPAAVLVDASGVDPFVTRALRQPGNGRTGLVLIRRAMWQRHIDPATLDAAQHCRLVLEPGDLASAADQGPTVTEVARFGGYARVIRTAPVLLSEGNAPLGRAAARKVLGLPRWGRRVLVSLGGEAFGHDATLDESLTLAADRAGMQLVWAQSPLSRALQNRAPMRHEVRQAYPLGRLLPAFDGMIISCGYNSFHEALMGSKMPVLLVPTLNERRDDQAARAGHAAAMGWAHLLDPGSTVDERAAVLAAFFAAVRDGGPADRPAVPLPQGASGAAEMAQIILDEFAQGPA